MAFGLKHWLAVVLGGFLLITGWALPLRHEGEWIQGSWFYRHRTPEYVAHRTVLTKMRRQAYIYQRLLWRDSLSSLARSARDAGQGITVALPEGAPEGYASGLREAVREQFLELGVARPQVTLGVVFMDARAMTHPRSPSDQGLRNTREELFLSNDAGNLYCIRVVPLRRSGEEKWMGLDRKWTDMVTLPPGRDGAPAPLGPCLLHAKYGPPGEGVFRWLWSVGYSFGRTALHPRTGSSGQTTVDLSRDPFGLRFGYFWSGGNLLPPAESCLMGDEDACLRAVTEPEGYNTYWYGNPPDRGLAPDGSPLARETDFRYTERAFGTLDAYMLWDLEREYGRERFQRFWSSEADIEEAFHAAFGEPMGAWVRRWAQGHLGPLHAATPVPLRASLLTLLTVVVLGLLAVRVQRRRA